MRHAGRTPHRFLLRLLTVSAICGGTLLAMFFGGEAFAQSGLTQGDIPTDDGPSPLSARVIQTFLAVTVLSLAPGIAMMITCLPFMIVVLGILRQAIGLQQSPPNMMIVSLALFLTLFVMEPVFKEAWALGVTPYLDNLITEQQAIERTLEPFRRFMESRVSPVAVSTLAEALPQNAEVRADGTAPMRVLIPAFMLSEIQKAFEVGFMLFLPFVLIDLIVASILMAMGMMMVPPAVIALPFKLIFFVLSNGWTLVAAALVRGYAS